MIDASFVKAILDSAETKLIVGADGKQYSSKPLVNLPLPIEPPFPTIELWTLDSLADYIKANKDKISEGLINVSYDEVKFLGPPTGENRNRDVFALVNCGVEYRINDGYLDLETFRINLLTQFSDNHHDDKETVLKFIANLVDETVINSKDDGVSQTVTAKTGIASFGQVTVPSPVHLSPIRTFIEVEQPTGLFHFRMKKGAHGPEAALLEIHTNWKREAAMRVAAYLKQKEELKDLTILA